MYKSTEKVIPYPRYLESLEKKVDLITNKFNVSLDVLEKKIAEIEGLVSILDEDYYNIKKDTVEILSALEPFVADIKEYPIFKTTVMNEIKVLSESLEKVSEILRDHTTRIKRLENARKVMVKEI